MPGIVARCQTAPPMSNRPEVIEDALANEAGPKFMGIPERWLDNPHWRCENGHVSKHYLKSEALGRAACLECMGRMWITFPEDSDDVKA